MTEFYFIRHGDADYSEKGTKIYKNQGAFMCTLSQKGIEQAKFIFICWICLRWSRCCIAQHNTKYQNLQR